MSLENWAKPTCRPNSMAPRIALLVRASRSSLGMLLPVFWIRPMIANMLLVVSNACRFHHFDFQPL